MLFILSSNSYGGSYYYFYELLNVLKLRLGVTSNKRLENKAKEICQKALPSQCRDRDNTQYKPVMLAVKFDCEILSRFEYPP
jgi:hypothetical protein